MTPPDGSYDLPELATRSGVSIRTVRYYIQQGLLPSPETRGPGAHYTEEHLERLLRIKRLQRDHLPLAEIRRILESSASEGKPPASAKDYIQEVLGRGATAPPIYSKPPLYEDTVVASPISQLSPGLTENAATYEMASPAVTPSINKPPARSQWERLTLAQDIELHIRRPLSRHVNKQLERLLEAAREILKEEE